MQNEIVFTERQKFRQWWLWALLLGVNFMCLFSVYKQLIEGQQFGKPTSNGGLIFAAILTLLITILFWKLRLETLIKNDGIYVRFFPFHFTYKRYSWDSLSKSYVRKYSPLFEYGGWGIRFGVFGKGKAYNVSGNQGLQLEFTNNKRLLIGTNKPGELKAALNGMGHYTE